jgi:serralysin
MSLSDLFADATPTRYIWVSPTGSNANSGSKGSPLKTIQAAVDKATPGTAIMVKAGTYKESVKLKHSGEPDAPIWLQSADGKGAAKIVATSSNAIYGYGEENIVIRGFDIKGGQSTNPSSGNGIQFGMAIDSRWQKLGSSHPDYLKDVPRNIVIEDNIIHDSKVDNIKISQGFNIVVRNNEIRGGAEQEAVDFVTVRNALVSNNTITNVKGNSAITVKGGSRDIDIANNLIKNVGLVGIKIGGNTTDNMIPQGVRYEASDIRVFGNDISGVGKASIAFLGGRNSHAYGNKLTSILVEDVTSKWQTSNNQISGNVFGSSNWLKVVGGADRGLSLSGNKVGGSWSGKAGVGTSQPVLTPPAAQKPAPATPEPVSGKWAETADPAKWISGGKGSETLTGTTANDKMTGNGGEDTMVGGRGDDTYIVDSAGDRVVEKTGEGIDQILLWTNSHQMADHVENLVIKLGGGATVTGNKLDNVIIGGTGADVINGGAGNDRLTGGGGTDTFVVKAGQGSDTITDFTAQDRVQLDGTRFAKPSEAVAALRQAGADTLLDLGNGQILTFKGIKTAALSEKQFALSGSVAQLPVPSAPAPALPSPAAPKYVPGSWAETADPARWVSGGRGNDTLRGSDANDKMIGNGGEDTLAGGRGDDTYIVDSAGDRVVEKAGEGIDQILLWTDKHQMAEHVENLVIKLGGGAAVTGNGLDNVITGGAGADVIRGGLGADRLSGGGGNDLFVFRNGELAGDRIDDFDGKGAGAGDVLRFEGFGSGARLTNAGDIWTLHHAAGAETFQLAGVTGLNANDVVFA